MHGQTACACNSAWRSSFCRSRTPAGVLLLALLLLGCYQPVCLITEYDPDQAYNGYTFFQSNYLFPAAFCVDMEGNQLWGRHAAIGLEGTLLGIDVLNDGNVITNLKGYPQIFNPVTDSLVWEDSSRLAHHSLIRTPWESVVFLSSDPFVVADYPPWKDCLIFGDVILEIDMQTHAIVWEWYLRDYLDPLEHHWDGMCDTPEQSDWSHSNTIKYYPNYVFRGKRHNVLLLNSRHLDTIWMIDYPSGEVLWSCGQHGEFGRREPPAAPVFSWAHEVGMLPNGHFLMYDNGDERQVLVSRALEIAVDPVAQTVKEVWSWTEGQYDYGMGDADRLPNANTLLTSVVKGKIVEVNPLGEKVWEMRMRSLANPNDENLNTIYKAIRVTNFGPP